MKVQQMKLAAFIGAKMPQILAEWTAFARTIEPNSAQMSELALRDHAEAILRTVALDIETNQSKQQQFDKSQGSTMPAAEEETAAAIHGRLRHASNFSLLQLSSEFRALRATVLRLWLPEVSQMSATSTYEMVRFNEAIDQALAESIVTYSARADRTKDLFVAVLSHDLRAPLANITTAVDLLARQASMSEHAISLATKAKRSAMLMGAMVTDLLGFTRLQMGATLPASRTRIDADEVFQAAATDARAMYPASAIIYRPSGSLVGAFDGLRLHQLTTNLLINAAQYSTKGKEVVLEAEGLAETIVVRVSNIGPVIAPEALKTIFQPLVQLNLDAELDARPNTSLGLGLFIAQEAAWVHDATITVSSSESVGTVFTVTFPRTVAP